MTTDKRLGRLVRAELSPRRELIAGRLRAVLGIASVALGRVVRQYGHTAAFARHLLAERLLATAPLVGQRSVIGHATVGAGDTRHLPKSRQLTPAVQRLAVQLDISRGAGGHGHAASPSGRTTGEDR
jgi:hypothetical protein